MEGRKLLPLFATVVCSSITITIHSKYHAPFSNANNATREPLLKDDYLDPSIFPPTMVAAVCILKTPRTTNTSVDAFDANDSLRHVEVMIRGDGSMKYYVG